MDQATRNRIAAEQLVGLTRLKHGRTPPGVAAGPTVADMVADARLKYLSHIWADLSVFFPMYCHYRRPSPRKLASMLDGLALATDPFANVDPLFETLVHDVRRLAQRGAWHDLLLIERGIAKSRIARRVGDSTTQLKRRLRGLRPGKRLAIDRGGVFFVVLSTDLITAFGYPGRDPRRARRVPRPIRAAIFRRPRTHQPELVWIA